MKTLLFMTLSGSLLSLLLLALRYKALKKMPSTVYYYAWLLVLLRFAIPFPGLIPAAVRAKTHEVHNRTVFVSNVRRTNNDLTRNTVSSEKEKTSFIPSKTAQADMGDDAPAQEIISEKTPVRRIHWIAPGFWIMFWAFGTILSMALTMLAYLRFILHIRHSLHRIDSHTRELYDSIPGRKPALFYSDQVHTPMMFGVFSPKIVLPERACDEEMLHNILRHELMHYRRFDTLYKWFAVTVLSAHWFNPLSMIARRELNRACELSCDEMLLRSMSLREKRSYGNTLLSMAASALPAGVVATTFATQKRDLKERLVQIMNYKKSGTRIVTAALAVLLLSGCCMAAGLKTEAESPDDISPDAGSVTTVSNVDEFLAAIAPDTTIILKDGEYDLSTAANYCAESDNPYYAWEEVWDDEGRTHAELVISGADGLTIEGEGMDQTVIRAVPRYANVIRFAGCSDLTVRKLTAGHTEAPGLCAGGVLMIESCSNVSVADCGLYGCGTVGVDGWYTNNLSVTGCKIYECSCEAVNLFYCRDARVEQCSVYRHGIRDGQDPAMAVFNINSSDDILIHDNDVYENNAQYLLSQSYTRNAVFLSNKIHDNRFEYSVFLFDQYGAAVDGCAFTDNDTFGSFVQGSGAFAYDVSGNLLEESDLASMTFREIDPETTAVSSPVSSAVDVEPGGSIEVTTIDEFLAAIGPDRTIILDGKEFDLSAASNYGTVGGEYYYWEDCYDGPQLVIENVSGLEIRAKTDDPKATTLSAVPRYANVLTFRNCDGLQVAGFTAGHTKEQGSCSGGVLGFSNCSNVRTENMRLYGCGILGIQTSNCSDITVLHTEIYECSYGGAEFIYTSGIKFDDCDIHDVPSPALSFTGCTQISWNNESVSDLDGTYDVGTDGSLQLLQHTQETFGFTGRVEDLVNPFAAQPVHYHQDGTQQAVFADSVRKAFADKDWETLADKMLYPVQIFTPEYSFSVQTREEFTDSLGESGYMLDEYCAQIASADITEYGACAYGETTCDHLIAFTCYGSEDEPHITAISLGTPFYPGWG